MTLADRFAAGMPVNLLDLATQSAACSSQTRVASHELSRLAVDLNKVVVRFVI